ncbi:MAG: anthranilate synthase component I family protein [Candidatus Eisenbacteria bacterium]|nr:anthranilate synthase component I family protein [Candidatus Eisenbacteria bacterium]
MMLAEEVFPAGDPFEALAGIPGAFVLRSSLADDTRPGLARWTLFGAAPFARFHGGDTPVAYDTFRAAAAAAGDCGVARALGVPFWGGAVGYWAYDFGRRLEQWHDEARDDVGLPDFVMALYDVVGAHDHVSGRTWLFSSGLPAPEHERAARARLRLDSFRMKLESAEIAPAPEAPLRVPRLARSTFSAAGYRRAVDDVREAIRRGDIFQANLSQRWSLEWPGAHRHALALDAAMRAHTPSPFAATLVLDDHVVCSASPERFLRVSGRHVETRPIKGTRPRGADDATDRALAAELLGSAKDRAENVMIVDVLRNDLGRVCETGSVRVPELCALECFPQVWHLTSTVTGTLRDDVDAFELLHACFPGGSITGAPKLRAIEILESLEPVRRHVYTGAIGWLGWDGDADWNIAIRTAVATRHGVHWNAGGGITADSDPEAEYRESLTKGEGVKRALESVLGPIQLG